MGKKIHFFSLFLIKNSHHPSKLQIINTLSTFLYFSHGKIPIQTHIKSNRIDMHPIVFAIIHYIFKHSRYNYEIR